MQKLFKARMFVYISREFDGASSVRLRSICGRPSSIHSSSTRSSINKTHRFTANRALRHILWFCCCVACVRSRLTPRSHQHSYSILSSGMPLQRHISTRLYGLQHENCSFFNSRNSWKRLKNCQCFVIYNLQFHKGM